MTDIKILVCHTPDKKCNQVDNPVYLPIYGGKALAHDTATDFQGDDTGDNISVKNESYCELTVQYWAWKNLQADYYGFCQYRRYFDFSGQNRPKNALGRFEADYIDERTIATHNLVGSALQKIIAAEDIIVTPQVDLKKLPGHFSNHYEYFEGSSAGLLQKKDLVTLLQIVEELSPAYFETADVCLNASKGYFCNMYIMRKPIFYAYCAWLFPILLAFEERTDMSQYSIASYRTIEHLAERLCTIFIQYQKEMHPEYKIKELPYVFIAHPEKQMPLYKIDGDNIVPVIFAANDAYIGPLAVAIQSVLNNATTGHQYDVIVLESDISEENKKHLTHMFTNYPQAQIRFLNALPFVEGYDLNPRRYLSKETYFRLIVQEILPDYDKVVYLDSDLVVKADIADLYETDIGGYALAAAKDIGVISQINGADSLAAAYAKDKLCLQNPYQYFQAGVLLLNLKELRRMHSVDEWLKLASVNYWYNDQDVLNVHCQGKVKFLSQEWNILTNNNNTRITKECQYLPRELRKEYDEAALQPKILHFAGSAKPWKKLPEPDFDSFWIVARQTPFYELLLYNMFFTREPSLKKYVRKLIDLVLPINSRRREEFKRLFSIGKHYQ